MEDQGFLARFRILPKEGQNEVVFLLVALQQAFPTIGAIKGDPNRWSAPYIYVCLAAVLYALAMLAAYPALTMGRRSNRQPWWFMSPFLLVVMSFVWTRFHDEINLCVAFVERTAAGFFQ